MRYIVATVASLVASFVVVVSWLLGVVIAKGITSTLAAIFIPFYAWYLVVEYGFQRWLA